LVEHAALVEQLRRARVQLLRYSAEDPVAREIINILDGRELDGRE
jgi:hypothetical protein